MQNDAGTREEKWHVTDTRRSVDVPAGSEDVLTAKENPGNAGGRSGADVQSTITSGEDNPGLPTYATAFVEAVVGLPPEDRLPLLEIAVDHFRAAEPIPPLFSYMQEARSWASLACRGELKAYCAACWERLSPEDQSAFRTFITQERAAA